MIETTLPATLHEVRGNHQVAIDRTVDISKYVQQAVHCLREAMKEEHGSHLRGGFLRQGDDFLDVIIRLAKCAKSELRTAYYTPEYPESR